MGPHGAKGQDRRRICDLNLQVRRGCLGGDLFPLGEVATNHVVVTVASNCGIGEIGELPPADEGMDRDAGGVEDPNGTH